MRRKRSSDPSLIADGARKGPVRSEMIRAVPTNTDRYHRTKLSARQRRTSPACTVAGTVAESQGVVMTSKRVWFITGASRGMGVDFANAALAAGHAVVATARDSGRVSQALGQSDDLLAVKLDVTSRVEAEAAVRMAVERFGRIDVLINNAADFQAGFFEEMSPEQFRAQIEVNLFGTLNVTRAVLTVMRRQRAGHVITISSTAGLASAAEFTSAYAASKFAVEGWMEALRVEVAPFGIHTTVVNPGFFRTQLLSEQSTRYAEPSIPDYDARRAPLLAAWRRRTDSR